MKKLIAFATIFLMLAVAAAGCAAEPVTASKIPEPTAVQTPSPTIPPTPTPTPIPTPTPTPEPTPIQSFFPLPSPVVTPAPEYLNKLRKNAAEVNTDQEFNKALKSAYVIELKKDITLSGDIYLRSINALIIDEGVTLTITSLNFLADCTIVNLGEIIVEDQGRMIFHTEPNYSYIGKISIKGRDAKICFNAGKISGDKIAYFLREGSLFNQLSIVASSSGKKPVEILIKHNIFIPAGKTLWINSMSVLHVKKGVTLTNDGAIRYYNKPIIEGKIDGIGKVVYDD